MEIPFTMVIPKNPKRILKHNITPKRVAIASKILESDPLRVFVTCVAVGLVVSLRLTINNNADVTDSGGIYS